jgi:pimeloyl-ACP methyl ester carboxylesterase
MQRRIDAGGTGLDVLEDGAGGSPLLVLHGFCGAKENFADVVPFIAEGGWHVVVPDQRGHGSSDHPDGEGAYEYETFIEDALELADALGWGRFTLLGHSMGGMVALRLVIGHPERVGGLILMDTSYRPFDVDPELAAAGRMIVETGGMKGLVEALRGGEDPLATEAHRRLLQERPEYEVVLEAQNLACSAQMWLAMSKEILEGSDLVGELPKIAVPTLVVVGEQDTPFLDSSRVMAREIRNARLAVIEDAGHSPQLEAPGPWLAAVTSFLDDLRR